MKRLILGIVMLAMATMAFAGGSGSVQVTPVVGNAPYAPSTGLQVEYSIGTAYWDNGLLKFTVPAGLPTPNLTPGTGSGITITTKYAKIGAVTRSGNVISVPVVSMEANYGKVILHYGAAVSGLTPVMTPIHTGSFTWAVSNYEVHVGPATVTPTTAAVTKGTFRMAITPVVGTPTITPTVNQTEVPATSTPTLTATMTPGTNSPKTVSAPLVISSVPTSLKNLTILSRTGGGPLYVANGTSASDAVAGWTIASVSPSAADMEKGLVFYPLTSSITDSGLYFNRGCILWCPGGVSYTVKVSK